MSEKLTWEAVGKSSEGKILSPAWSVGNLVFTAGTVGNRPDGSYPETIEEQTELVLKNLDNVLRAAGASLETTVKTLVFIANTEDQPKLNAVYGKIVTHQPARSCVAVKFPNPKILVEIEAVATKTGHKL
ncbi:unnamed protein product [Ambrosiozyma monospora]|uniref:Unnamed protein product n=1 Tax=Ambrosiozyma monospora TaxID=43982 RepID=A0ACB5TCZ6_AMBMO|nr:unnamed protein product [Ambrosiozyma monospora]